MTTRMVLHPQSLDTLVATNLHLDILSDQASSLSGSHGIGPTANLNPERNFPSLFEPIHGSAFEIGGQGLVNPLGSFWTSGMMIEHLGETDAAKHLVKSIEKLTALGNHRPIDLGGSAGTKKVTA